MDIFAATSSPHKLGEFQRILGPHGFIVRPASSVRLIPDVDEDGSSFEENAVHKAVTVAAMLGVPVFADDSGLESVALGGEPGVHSARYAGANATDRERIDKLLFRLREHADRSARFVCVIAVAGTDGLLGTAIGEIRGVIALAPSGTNGFGYDPVFIPEGCHQTFAELSSSEKDHLSHRGRALRKAIECGLFSIGNSLPGS